MQISEKLNKILKNTLKLSLLFLTMGIVYYFIEILWRGYSSWEMVVVGGICALTIGLIDESYKLRRLSPLKQNILAVFVVLIIELIAGLYLNVYLGKAIWDYSNVPLNIFGQISLLYAFFWFLLCPFGFWLDNWLRFKLFKEEKPCSSFSYYRNIVRNL